MNDAKVVRRTTVKPIRDVHPGVNQPVQDSVEGLGSAHSED